MSTQFAKAEKKRFKMKVGVFLLLIQNSQVLLIRRYNTGIADGRHVVPMGSINEGETAAQALVREAKEEVNLTISIEDIKLAHTLHRTHHMPDGSTFAQVDLFFTPYTSVWEN